MSAAEAISRQLYLTEANEHLIAMRNQLQTSIDSIHSGIVLLDADYNISYVNAITLRTLNFAKEDMLNHSYREIFPNLELEKLKENTYDFECGLLLWMDWANNSFPVPLSPVIRTLVFP